jgi:signal transduction histidine kinase
MATVFHFNILSHLLYQFEQAQYQLQQSYKFATRLQSITTQVRDNIDEAQILQTAVRELGLALDVISCDTGIYDLSQQTSRIAYEYGLHQGQLIQGKVISMQDYPAIYQQLLQGEPVHFCWYTASPELSITSPTNFTPTADNARSIRGRFTALAYPIIDNQKVIGDLWLYRMGAKHFDAEEIWLVQQVAIQCAIAIRQARLYQSTQAQVTELARLKRLKDDFLATISHELRTPVSNIVMALQMLELQIQNTDLDPQQTEILNRSLAILKQESQREIALINDLLMLSRIDAETEPLVLTTIDPGVWITHIAEPFISDAARQQQHLKLDIAVNLPPLTTDLTDLERILTELLTNACKYTPAGETIMVSAQLAADPAIPCLEITISNTGIDLPIDECERIFDKFYRVPSSDPWRHQGTGLGLALVKKLAQRLGANIAASSSAGLIVFLLQLPLRQEVQPD